MGVFKQADGSAYIEMGNTKALATVYGPHEVTNKSKILHDRVLVNCQFSMATFSTGERKKRPKGDRRSTETSMHIRRTFEAAILTQLYPRSQIDIYVQVNIVMFGICTYVPKETKEIREGGYGVLMHVLVFWVDMCHLDCQRLSHSLRIQQPLIAPGPRRAFRERGVCDLQPEIPY